MAMVRALQGLKSYGLVYNGFRAMAHDSAGRMGSGEGKGGGSGGSIRSAGGAFGEIEAAREEEYFRKLQTEQIKRLHDHMEDEVQHQQSEISRLTEEVKRRQMKLDRLKEELSKKE